MKLKLGFAVVMAAAAAVLSGCVVFLGPVTSSQQDVIGKLRVSFTLCASGPDDGDDPDPENEDHPGCPDAGNVSNFAEEGGSVQILLAFRVPAGTGAPATIITDPAPTPPAGGPVSFTRSPTYESELQVFEPAPAGFVWVGYISSEYPFDDGADDVPAQTSQVNVDFDLPRPANGGPFAGPFRVRPVVGFRRVSGELPASRRVSCGESAYGEGFATTTACIDSPAEATVPSDLQFATRDLGVLGGAATANPGQTVQLPFDANLNGTLPAGTTFSVTAATNFPGVAVAPSPASFTPAPNAGTRITVPVAIPSSAGPGTFDVAVTASLPNGQSRIGISKLTVRDRQNPVAARLAIRPRTIRPQAPSVAAPARVSYRLSEAATMRFRVQRCRKVRRRTRCRTLRGAFTHAGQAGANRFRFTGFLRNRALRPGRYRLVGTPTDLATNKGKSVRASFRTKR